MNSKRNICWKLSIMPHIMPTIVGILTFISMINITCESLEARKVFVFHFSFCAQLECHVYEKSFIASGPAVELNMKQIPNLGVLPRYNKLLSCSTQFSMNFIVLINVKMLTIVIILTCISRINTASGCLKQENFIFQYVFSVFYAVEISCSDELSMKFFDNFEVWIH